MAAAQSIAGIDAILRGAELQHLLVIMIQHGLPKETAAKYAVDLSEFARGIEIGPNSSLSHYIDARARQYEDIASSLLGGQFLPRDPT